MERYWQFFAYNKFGSDEAMITDILEDESPRMLASSMERACSLSQPAKEGEETKYELRFVEYVRGETLDGAATVEGKVLGKWDVIRNRVPKGCRKPRACIMRDGQHIDLVRFCFDHLRAQAA